MLAGSTLNFSQASQVAALEIAIAVLEFPESCVRISGVENITFYRLLDVLSKRFNLHLYRVPLWKPYMLSWRTNEEMFVCLKYWLRTLVHQRHIFFL